MKIFVSTLGYVNGLDGVEFKRSISAIVEQCTVVEIKGDRRGLKQVH